jgi:hypothetical protein
VLVGHGLVERQVRGPTSTLTPPEEGVLTLRRYRCRACRAVVVVGPRGLIVRRRYGAGPIALALSLYAHGATSEMVRSRTSPMRTVGPSAVDRWVTLVRWVEAARQGDLFGVVGLDDLTRRDVAQRIELALAARAGHQLGADLTESAFAGAMIVA